MKVTRIDPPTTFRPVVITLESEKELEIMAAIMRLDITVPKAIDQMHHPTVNGKTDVRPFMHDITSRLTL